MLNDLRDEFPDLTDSTTNKVLTLRRLEKTIEDGLRTFVEVGKALLRIRDEQLYRPDYSTFEDYCRQKWDIDRSYAYRLMNSAQVIQNLEMSPIGNIVPANEAQARPLALLPVQQQPEAWDEAVKASPGKPPSAGLVRTIVDRLRAKAKKEIEDGLRMEFHPLAEVFPMFSAQELDELARDIKANGLKEAIVVYEGKILDGRNRYLACKIAKVEPRINEYQGKDPIAFLLGQNLYRYHFSTKERAEIAAKIANMPGHRPKSAGPRNADPMSDLV